MNRMIAVTLTCCFVAVSAFDVWAQDTMWEDGGPAYIYVKPGKKPVHHMPYDEALQCVDCHAWDGVDAYSSATMGLKKSKTGRLPRAEIGTAVVQALRGTGNYREMYALATAFGSQPLATCIEFTLDPQTFTWYASSEKQTEKLFHLAANANVSLVWVKPRADLDYFKNPLGVQIVGTAELLKAGDPGFEEARNICLSTVRLPPGVVLSEPLLKQIRKNQLVTKITPRRIVITSHAFRARGQHLKQIWEAQ